MIDNRETCGCGASFIPLEQHHEWARHYDNIQWTVTGVLLGASGALLFHVLSSDNPSPSKVTSLGALGVGLILLSILSVAICRGLRYQVQSRLPPEHLSLCTNRREGLKITHGTLNKASHICFASAWILLITNRGPMLTRGMGAGLLICLVVFGVLMLDEITGDSGK